jgi:hypothetical protein
MKQAADHSHSRNTHACLSNAIMQSVITRSQLSGLGMT